MSFNTTRRVLPLVLAATVLTANAGAAEKLESTFTSHEMVLDGDPVDWQGFPIAYLEDSLHVMSIAHDGNNLYLMYRFADHGLARRILMRGVTLWINGDGKTKKKNEEFAVRYPGSEQIAEQFEDEDSWQGRSRPDETGTTGRGGPPPSLASMRQVPGRLTVIRMGMKETVDENDPDGPTAASAHNEGVFCYELKIPFAGIGGTIADTSPSKKRKVAIGIQIGGMTEAEMEMLEAAMKEKMGETGGMHGWQSWRRRHGRPRRRHAQPDEPRNRVAVGHPSAERIRSFAG
jgi:hypothetical protein